MANDDYENRPRRSSSSSRPSNSEYQSRRSSSSSSAPRRSSDGSARRSSGSSSSNYSSQRRSSSSSRSSSSRDYGTSQRSGERYTDQAPQLARRNQSSTSTRSARSNTGSYSKSGSYRGDGQYSRSKYVEVGQTSRNQYTRGAHSSGAATAAKQRRNKITAIIAGIVVLALAIGVIAFIRTRPIDIVVNGRNVEVAYSTTYEDLHEQGYLTATYGDLLAVDGSLLEQGGGDIYQIFDNGELVAKYNRRVNSHSVITEARGNDTYEEYETTSTVVPWTTEYQHVDDFNFYNGSLHFYATQGTDGVQVTHTGRTSGITVESPEESTPMIPRTFIDVTYEPTDGSMPIALTFDDGPTPGSTEYVLEKLQYYGVRATFFELGSQADAFPELSAQVRDAGHQVASHSYDHDSEFYLNKLDDDACRWEIQAAKDALYNATGLDVTCVRPPGGNVNIYNILATSDIMLECVGWDIDTEDWRRPGADVIAQTVLAEARPGAVILMHDGGGDRSQTIEALDIIIPALQEQGYTFVTVDEMCQLAAQQYMRDMGYVQTTEDAGDAEAEAEAA